MDIKKKKTGELEYNFTISITELEDYISTIEKLIGKMRNFEVNSLEYINLQGMVIDIIFIFEKKYLLYFAYKDDIFKYAHINQLIRIVKKFQLASGPNMKDFDAVEIV